MNKRQLEKIEREKLKQMIENNPKLKSFLDANADSEENKDLVELITPVVQDTFEKVRMTGVWVGWYAHTLQCASKIKDCKTVKEVVDMLNKDVKAAELKLKLKGV